MNRRDWIIKSGLSGAGLLFLNNSLLACRLPTNPDTTYFTKADFGPDFKWGSPELRTRVKEHGTLMAKANRTGTVFSCSR